MPKVDTKIHSKTPRRRESDRLVLTGRSVMALILAFAGGGFLGSSGVARFELDDCRNALDQRIDDVVREMRGTR